MKTGNSYLLHEDLCQDLGGRIHGGDAALMAGNLTSIATADSARHSSESRALPLRGLDPDVLDEVNDDVDDYAAHCLASATLESLFDVVIATAELRAGVAIVREVLTALASTRDGLTLAELVADEADRTTSVVHVLSVLGNHLHRSHNRFRLTPVLRAAVELRYPLGVARQSSITTMRIEPGVASVDVARYRRTWRQSA